MGANEAGLVNDLRDGLVWSLFPLFFAAEGLPLREMGRRPMIVAGRCYFRRPDSGGFALESGTTRAARGGRSGSGRRGMREWGKELPLH